ncbi:hypothetical protein DQ238_13075 [Geodermatophilus sp. TF02-6]|uniref:hypothetical protein n=1 Tax=Geodermatophilus sp. TF02-6 TaxID=2250575 RepID=UPI000DEADE83|nr:hypothetical protein [Geodermatophilus sp. TF02-6]RBY78131.1 hypothetical protein DQ238_13075 [Geodermatophilus sp. TF02-6]
MDGPSRSSRARRVRARVASVALAAVVAVVGLVAAPGTASAASKTVTPTLDCLRENGDGTYTAILGYTNTSKNPVTIPVGSWNQVQPARFDGPQPTVFQPGTKRGAYTVTLTQDEYMGGPSWYLGGTFVFFGWSWTHDGKAPTCPPSTELPEEGNGTGPLIALAVAGVVGALVVHRTRRGAQAAGRDTGAGRGDA